MKRWQSEIVNRDLSTALEELRQADLAGDTWRVEMSLEDALRACRAALNRQHQDRIDEALRQHGQKQRGA